MRKILFSEKPDWEVLMRPALAEKYSCTFQSLRQCPNLDEYDFIVPLTCEDIIFLNEAHAQLRDRKFLTPPNALLRLADDKFLFNEHLRGKGHARFLPAPATRRPFILKKRIDVWGSNSRIVRDGDAAEFDPADFFTQEFIPGNREYVTHLLSKDGRVLYHSSREYRFDQDWYVKCSSTSPHTTKVIPTPAEHLPLFEQIIAELGFSGFSCLNYKLHAGGVKIFELNPRFGASLTTTAVAAIDCYITCLQG